MAHIAAIWTGSAWAATSGLIGSRLCAAGYGCGQIAPVAGSMQVTALLNTGGVRDGCMAGYDGAGGANAYGLQLSGLHHGLIPALIGPGGHGIIG